MYRKLVSKAVACNKRAILTASMTKEIMEKFCTSSEQTSRFSTILVSKTKSQGFSPGDVMSFSLKRDQIHVNRARKIGWTNFFFHYRGAEDNDPTSRLQSFQPFCDISKSSTGWMSRSQVFNLKGNSSLKETIKQALKEYDDTKKIRSWLSKVPLPVAIEVARRGYQIYQHFNDGDFSGDDKSFDDKEGSNTGDIDLNDSDKKEGSNEGEIDLNESDKQETGDRDITDGGLNSDGSSYEDNFSAAESYELDGAEIAEKARDILDFVSLLLF